MTDTRWAEKVTPRREALLAKQGGVCAICGTDNPGHPKGWNLDHDPTHCPPKRHRDCGECDRGVLCHRCNAQLVGVLERSGPDVVSAALRYLGWTPS